jgi:membrane fusion protein, heavy metal efflux system
MATTPLSVPRPRLGAEGLFALIGAVLGAALLLAALYFAGIVGRAADDPPHGAAPSDPPSSDEPALIKFEESKAKASGLRIAPAERRLMLQTLTRPGRITVNNRKVAHLSPMVEGIIREVPIHPGQNVKTGDVLIILDSKELGQAKLELAKARLALAIARAQHEWVEAVHNNTAELLQAMAQQIAIADIEKRFTGRPIGEWRQQLITAYSRHNRSKINLASLEKLETQGAASPVAMRAAQGEAETAEAAFQALREEINFQNQQQLRSAAQKLREAQGQAGVAEAYLLMVGYTKQEVTAMDPINEGAKIGYYPLRAPFDGTVLTVPSSLAERASPQAPVVQIGDLTRLQVVVDLTETDLPAVRQLPGRKIAIRGPGLDTPVEAEVSRIGDVVDQVTRTIPLVAMAANADRRLKPGMFIDAQIRYGPETPVIQVPASAIQRHAGRTFVFVPKGDDEFATVDVRLGRATADAVEIVDGIAEGQPVVVAGGFALKT